MARTDWLQAIGWGAFVHYLSRKEESAADWNERVNGVDVDRLAADLVSTGCGWFFLSIGQNSGHYCAPNRTYDELTGITPSKCSDRDLVADLATALDGAGIRLLVYSASGAPGHDEQAMDRLGWEWGFVGKWADGAYGPERTGKRLAEFQQKWEAVHREWAERWGDRIHGWWIDGCYFADEMYRHPAPPNFQSYAAALRAGNPDAILAFNPGVKVPIICHTDVEDYTAGEIAKALPECPGPKVETAQYHILSYLGESWGRGELRFPDEMVAGYTQHVRNRGGVITWDVKVDEECRIDPAALAQLQAIGRAQA